MASNETVHGATSNWFKPLRPAHWLILSKQNAQEILI